MSTKIYPMIIDKAIINPTIERATTFALAVVGTGVFWVGNVPLPFLFGPMAACLIAAFCGLKLKGFGQIAVGSRSILGVAVGATITPAFFSQLSDMLASVMLVPIFVLLIGLLGIPFFYKICRFDLITSYYAAMPGGLQDMVIFGEEAGGNPRILSLIHATRVLIIVTVAPLILVQFFGASLSNSPGEPASEMPMVQIILMVVAAVIGWKGGERVGLFGASILGPMIVTAVLALSGLIEARPPMEAIIIAQFFIGSAIGVHYVGVTFTELRKVVGASAIYMLILAGVALIFSSLANTFGLAGEVETFLAFAPGGQAEMAVLAIISGAELTYVVTHHVLRIILVIVGAPILVRYLNRSARPPY